MKIYDCFTFLNELDLLEIRLNILDPYVDHFVIAEQVVTHSGKQKPLFYQENKNKFKKFEHKIIYVVVEDPVDVNPFERDVFHKDAIIRGLKDCEDDDLILISDLDEIPDPDVFSQLIERCEDDKIYHFAQELFYYYLNVKETSGNLLAYCGEFEGVKEKKWLGSKMCTYKFLKNYPISKLRHPEMKDLGYRVYPGGWHFTYVGSNGDMSLKEKIEYKIESYAHQEFNNDSIKNKIDENVTSNKDLFYRPSQFKVVEIDHTFPKYIRENKEKYQYLIK